MESISLEMDDIFGGESGGEEDGYNGGVLPDLPEAAEEGNEDGAENDDNEDTTALLSKLKDLSKGAAKKVTRNPQPKLDANRLTSNRGIPLVPSLFKDIKLLGKGHEAADIKRIMGGFEQWAHRLFPKMPFDEVIERVEKLGAKKPVQTCVKRMRLDMPMISDDIPIEEDEDMNGNQSPPLDTSNNVDAEEAFDEMIRESMSNAVEEPTTVTVVENGVTSDHMPSNVMSQSTNSPLSSEVQERIERNKRLAMERRAKKLANTGMTALSSAASDSSSQQDPGNSQDTSSQSVLPPLDQTSESLKKLGDSGLLPKESDSTVDESLVESEGLTCERTTQMETDEIEFQESQPIKTIQSADESNVQADNSQGSQSVDPPNENSQIAVNCDDTNKNSSPTENNSGPLYNSNGSPSQILNSVAEEPKDEESNISQKEQIQPIDKNEETHATDEQLTSEADIHMESALSEKSDSQTVNDCGQDNSLNPSDSLCPNNKTNSTLNNVNEDFSSDEELLMSIA